MTSPVNLPSELEILRQQNADLMRRLDGLTNVVTDLAGQRSAPPPTPEPTDEELRDKPSLLLKKVQDMMNATVAPLNQDRLAFQRERMLESSIAQVKGMNPNWIKVWDKIEHALRYTISQANVEPTPQIVAYHIKAIFGDLIGNDPSLLNPTVTPPNLPSSNLPLENQDAPKIRELTPNEMTIAKERGWTAEEYIKRTGGENETFIVTRGGKK